LISGVPITLSAGHSTTVTDHLVLNVCNGAVLTFTVTATAQKPQREVVQRNCTVQSYDSDSLPDKGPDSAKAPLPRPTDHLTQLPTSPASTVTPGVP
jgi:hypothetical protein